MIKATAARSPGLQGSEAQAERLVIEATRGEQRFGDRLSGVLTGVATEPGGADSLAASWTSSWGGGRRSAADRTGLPAPDEG